MTRRRRSGPQSLEGKQDLKLRTSYINRLAGFWLACLGALLTPTAALAQTGGQPANGDAPPSSQAQLTLDDLRTFTDVFNQVRRNYVEGADDKTLLESAIRGMLSELDPHSSYISGEAYRDIRDSSEGRYEGIGVDVEPRRGRIEVIGVIDDSPADQAGIEPGDSIGDRSLKGRVHRSLHFRRGIAACLLR